MFDLDPARAVPPPDGAPGDRSVATVVGVVLGVIALVIVLSLIGGGSDESDGSSPPTSTSVPSTSAPSTPARPRPTTSIGPLLDEGVVLEPDLGLAFVAFRANGQVAVLDLGTGDQRVLAHQPIAHVQFARWVGTTFVVGGPGGDLKRLATDGSGRWEALDLPGTRLEHHWGGPPTIFWAWSRDEMRSHYALLSPDGTLDLVTGPDGVDISGLMPVGHIGDHLLLNSWDGIFVLGPDQRMQRIGFGWVLGSGGRYVVRRLCDDHLVCRLVRDELVEGVLDPRLQLDLGSAPSDGGGNHWAHPSPDGRAVALVSLDGSRSGLRIIPAGGGAPVVVERVVVEDPSRLTWVGGGDALVWWNDSNRMVNVVRVGGGGAPSEVASVPVNLPRSASIGPATVLLVPLADLPPGWAPTSD